ncbi:cytochrome-c peroxidase, partial [Salmonella enterica subsp. enterica serovar Anatum]|nr:cytochrome-c peroxidase [Salmonella enterica subsp. enterica serovar Anatum]
LYHDERLSGDSTISCAHCHALNAGGVDGRKTSIGVGGAVGPIWLDKAFTLPSGNTFARWRFAYRAYGPFLSPTDTNLLSGCKFS